jgi:hypothetical protein
MANKIEFVASLPQIQSAVKISGGDGSRVQLDIPDTELAAVVKLLTYKNKVFKVTIEPFED